MEVYQVIIIVALCAITIAYLLARYFNKDYLRFTAILKYVIKFLACALKGVSGIIPESVLVTTLAIVLENVIKAVTESEKLWLNDVIEKEKRNVYAKKYITDALSEADIIITEPIEAIIDGAIAAVCYLMPHETDDILSNDYPLLICEEDEIAEEKEDSVEE